MLGDSVAMIMIMRTPVELSGMTLCFGLGEKWSLANYPYVHTIGCSRSGWQILMFVTRRRDIPYNVYRLLVNEIETEKPQCLCLTEWRIGTMLCHATLRSGKYSEIHNGIISNPTSTLNFSLDDLF